MYLSSKQKLFLNYLLERLHFPVDKFREQYLEHLATHYEEFLNLAAIPIKRNTKTGEIVFPKDHGFKKYDERDGRLVPTRFNIIDLLMLECNIKRKRKFKALKPSEMSISATDISQFTFCPVAWSIAKTYELPKLMSTRLGASMHEQYKLLHFVRLRKPEGIDTTAEQNLQRHVTKLDCDSDGRELLRDLTDSVAIFVGTTRDGEERKYFIGKDNRYIGQPDYIFYNARTKKYFVVEEKFHMIPRPPRRDLPAGWRADHGYDPDAIDRVRQQTIFYENHLNQLRSYVHAIQEFKPLYGYLVYWRYFLADRDSGTEKPDRAIHIEQLRARKVSGSSDFDRNALKKVYVDIKRSMQNAGDKFDPKHRSPSKCAGCVQSVLCGHKTGRFDSFTYPYDQKYLNLKRVPFPEELRRADNTETSALMHEHDNGHFA